MIRRSAAACLELRPRYLEALTPLHFPEEAEVPETQAHLELRLLLYQLLCDTLGLEASVGSDQFVYYDAADPKQVIAPDVFVRIEPRGEFIRTWKVWERGAPDVAVEIVSRSDAPEESWERKLQRYQQVGVRELVRFDPAAAPEGQLRLWDRVQDVLRERAITGDAATRGVPSLVLDLHWRLAPGDGSPLALRVATGAQGEHLVPSRVEARKAEAEARKAEAEARKAAEARVKELEAALAALERAQAKPASSD